jgi:hypothetical protein
MFPESITLLSDPFDPRAAEFAVDGRFAADASDYVDR